MISEEPLPGWQRFEVEGAPPWFKTPPPRTVIRSRSNLKEYLEKEHDQGRKRDINGSEFSFKRRLGLKKRSSNNRLNSSESEMSNHVVELNSESSSNLAESEDTVMNPALRLVRNKEVLDHRKLLTNSSKSIDSFRINDGYQTPQTFPLLKERIASSSDLRAFLVKLHNDENIVEALDLMFSDSCLTEISKISTSEGPLVDFPVSINHNIYCEMCDYGMSQCPRLMLFVVNLVTRRGETILPSQVIKCATLFSTICFAANHNLNALVKLRSLSLQVDGLNNIGLNMLSDMGLTQCARSLSNHRDMLAQIGQNVMKLTAGKCPYQSTIDNCDFQQEHLTVENIEKETMDTSHLSTKSSPKKRSLSCL